MSFLKPPTQQPLHSKLIRQYYLHENGKSTNAFCTPAAEEANRDIATPYSVLRTLAGKGFNAAIHLPAIADPPGNLSSPVRSACKHAQIGALCDPACTSKTLKELPRHAARVFTLRSCLGHFAIPSKTKMRDAEAMTFSGTPGLADTGDSQLLGEFSQTCQYAGMRELQADGHALSENGLQTGT
jgi:hypothetical protein